MMGFNVRRPDIAWLEKAILITFPIVGLGAMAMLLYLEMYNFAMLGVYLAVPMICAPAIYMFYKNHGHSLQEVSGWYHKLLTAPWAFKLFCVLFLTAFTCSVLLLACFEVRPLLYYVIVAAIASVILLEILTLPMSRERTTVILAQVALLAISLIWGVSLKYEYFIGRTDSLAHAFYITSLLQEGHVTAAFGDYQSFPLWHILCSEVYIFTGLDCSTMQVTYVVCGLFFAALPVFAYMAGMKLTGDAKVSLVTALVMSFYPYFQVLGTQGLSRSITSGLFIILLYLLLCKDSRLKMLAIPVTVAILAYHPVAIIFMMAILALSYVLHKLFRPSGGSFISVNYLLLVILMTVAYWMIFGGGPLQDLFISVSAPEAEGVITHSVYNVPASELFNYLQYGIVILFIILGALFALGSREHNKNTKIFTAISVILIPLSFPGPLYLVNKLADNMNLERFYENGILFVSLAAAICVCGVFFRSGPAGKAILLVVFASLVFFSVSNDFVASDNPVVKREFYTFYFTDQEAASFSHVPQMAAGKVLSDYVAARYMAFSPYKNYTGLIEIDPGNNTLIHGMEGDIMLIRDGELNNRPVKLYVAGGSEFIVNPDWDSLAYFYREGPLDGASLGRYDRLYDSGDVSAIG